MEPSLTLIPAISAQERENILVEAQSEIRGLTGALGPGGQVQTYNEALQEVDDFRKAIVEFGAFPDVIPFGEASFAKYGWPVPQDFDHLDKYFNFYWVRFPVLLRPAPKSSYRKLEYEVEFGPNIAEDHLKPKAHLIFPAKKFKELLSLKARLKLGVSGAVGLGASLPTPNFSYFEISDAEAVGKVDGKVDVSIGPFDLTMRKAEIDHTAEGAQKVYWQLADTELIQTDNPSPIVVLQVPKDIQEVAVRAEMQAFHSPTLGWELMQVYDYLTSKIQNFLKGGSPVPAEPGNWENILQRLD
jgi:hypothetical protein